MATGAGRQAGGARTSVANTGGDAWLPVEGARAWKEGAVSPLIIEISDDDYRSFCFPCHALEESDGGNAGT